MLVRSLLHLFFVLIALFGMTIRVMALTESEALEHASRLFVRLNAVRPNTQTLNAMKTHILNNRADLAAFLAMDESRLNFYKVVLPDLFSTWKAPEGESSTTLDDFIATVVGLVINNQRFDEIVYGDVIYAARPSLTEFNLDLMPGAGESIQSVWYNGNSFIRARPIDFNNNSYPVPPPGRVRPILTSTMVNQNPNIRISWNDNAHYEDLAKNIPDWPLQIVRYSQIQVTGMTQFPGNATDGIYRLTPSTVGGALTLRSMGLGYFYQGSNRRPIKFFAQHLWGTTIEALNDPTRPDNFVRTDVDRNPGGNPATYESCRGCHAGMDALINVFAPFDFSNSPTSYNVGFIGNYGTKIYRQFRTFPDGFLISQSNYTTWNNPWADGQNASLGWRIPPGLSSVRTGTGVNSLMRVIAATEAFSNNLARISFEQVCGRNPSVQELPGVHAMARQFESGFPSYTALSASGPYNLRALIARMTPFCFGENF